MSSQIERYWAQFLGTLPSGARSPRLVEPFFFGIEPSDANEINPLVLAGIKTATGSLLWSIEADGKEMARVDDHWVVTDGGEVPVCIIRTTDVQVVPFEDVGVEYAHWGGEGDRTLDSWRDMYWTYISKECGRIGRSPNRRAPLVMERFEVVHSEPLEENGRGD